MGHLPRGYRPSTTRRASGLERINESNENWKKAVNRLKIDREIRTKGFAIRGRFRVSNSSPPVRKNATKVTLLKNTTPGIYFMGQPYSRGRFKIENIYGFVPIKK